MTTIDPLALTCPVPIPEGSRVILGHGSGGQLSGALMRDVLAPCLADASPGGPLNDAAVLELGDAPAGVHHRLVRGLARWCSRAATSPSSRSTAPSTTWR